MFRRLGKGVRAKPHPIDHNQELLRRIFREKKVHCDQPNCSFRTVNNALLERHKQQAHSKERPFVCHKCGKSYKISIALKTHMKSHFAQDTKKRLISINKFVCDEPGCNFKASKSDYLIGHKMSVHSNSKVFKCKLESCAMEFATSRGLREHKKSHKRDEVKRSEEMDTEEDMVIAFDQSCQKFVWVLWDGSFLNTHNIYPKDPPTIPSV